MSRRKFFCACALPLLLAIATSTQGAVLFDESAVVVKTGARVVVPDSHTFSIAAAGMYRVTLTNVGISPAQNPKLIVTRGIDVVARVESALAPQNSIDVTLAPGNYVLRLAGRAPAGSASQLNASVSQGSLQVASHAIGLVPLAPADPTLGTLQTSFQIANAGTYSIELIDQQFPAALASLQLTVVSNGVPVACIPANPTACPGSSGNSFTAGPGEYQLFVLAHAQPITPAGLFSVRVADLTAGQVAYARTHTVGTMTSSEAVSLPTAATYTLTGTNLPAPAVPLSQLHIALVQDANVTALKTITTIASASFAGRSGDSALYVYAKTSTLDPAGSYGVQITQGSQIVLSDVRAVNTSLPSKNEAFNFRVPLPSAGVYRIDVRDFELPTLGALRSAVIQDGVVLDSANTAGAVTVNAQPGNLDLAVLATARSGDLFAKGLIGVAVTTQAGNALFERTQGVGGLFQSRIVTVASPARYQASFLDQRLPIAFDELLLVLTRGATRVASIYAAGGLTPTTTQFDVTPGEYTVSLLAVSPGIEDYGLYGIKMEDVTTPPSQPSPGATGATPSGAAGGGGQFSILAMALLALLIWGRAHLARRRTSGISRDSVL